MSLADDVISLFEIKAYNRKTKVKVNRSVEYDPVLPKNPKDYEVVDGITVGKYMAVVKDDNEYVLIHRPTGGAFARDSDKEILKEIGHKFDLLAGDKLDWDDPRKAKNFDLQDLYQKAFDLATNKPNGRQGKRRIFRDD